MISKDTFFSKKRTLNIRGEIVDLSRPLVMGILNITPDSFYDGGKYIGENRMLAQAEKIISEGASIVDIGAYSSRPGADHISEKEEFERLKPVVTMVRKRFPSTILSVDTFRSALAQKMVTDYGVDMINDISAGSMDEKMFSTIAALKVPYIIMHMQGNPSNMQDHPIYKNVTQDLLVYFAKKTEALKLSGIPDVIIDPGFGFGKTLDHNYELLANLDAFGMVGMPVMVGLSRKSMIYKFFGDRPEDALNGTTVLHTIALLKGADILRVHDVKEAMQAIALVEKMNQSKK